MKKVFQKAKENLKKRSASPAETTRLLHDGRQPQSEHTADPVLRTALRLNMSVANLRRHTKRPSCDSPLSHGTEISFGALMKTRQYHEACLLTSELEEKGEAAGSLDYFRPITQKMWEALSKTLTGDHNRIQSTPEYLKWIKKNQSDTKYDWDQQQWSKELEELFEGHINGQVPKITQKTVDKKSLQDHLVNLKYKISEMVARLCPLPPDLTATYLKCFHVYLLNEVSSIAERKLGYNEQVFLYKWTIGERRTLCHLHQGAEDFDPMLFEKWFTDNGLKILSSGEEEIRETLKESLQSEICWNFSAIGDSGRGFSDVQAKLTDICEAVQGISDTLESRLKSALWEEFFQFLSRYEEFLKTKIDKAVEMTSGRGVLMGLRTVRNCHTLRDTLRNLGKVELESNLQELLDRCDHKGTEVVLRVLTPALKDAFKKYFRKNSDEYEHILQQYERALQNQQMEHKKTFNTVMEHRITTLFIKSAFKHRHRLSPTNRGQIVVLASRKLLLFFSKLDSDSVHLGTNPLRRMDEMLTTQCPKALQITVKVFLDEQPDLRQEHLLAILDIKGNTRGQEKQELLYYLQNRSCFPPENQLKFFEDVDLQCERLKSFLCCPCGW